jgi:transposase-like protein
LVVAAPESPPRDTSPTAEEITEALAATGGNVQAAADRLGRSRSSLSVRIDKLGLSHLKRPAPRRRLDDRPILDPARLAEDQEASELRHLRRETKDLREELAKREEVVQRILDAINLPVEVPSYDLAKQDDSLPIRAGIAPIYDIQYGQHVRPTDVPLRAGGHTSDDFERKLARWLKAVTGSVRDYATSHRIEEFLIPLGGDLVEGLDIFAGQAWQLDKDPAVQSRDLAALLANALIALIRFLKEEIGVERVGVLAVPGNHGKVGGKRAGATPTTLSWDWLTVEILQLHLAGQPIDLWVNEPSGALLFESLDHTFLMIHGDEIKGHSGIPFYGLTKFDGRAMRLARVVYDYCLLGHHHQQSAIPNGSGGEFLMSGDWIGGNNLSKFLVGATRPQQRLMFTSRRWGITEQIPIYLEESSKERRPEIHSIKEKAA